MKTIFFSLISGIFFLFSGCQLEDTINPDIQPEPTIETKESEELTRAMSKKMIETNSSIQLISGDLPGKSNISSAPKLVDWADSDTLHTMNGKITGMQLDFEYEGHEIAGYYLKVGDASNYLDIPVELAKDFKKQKGSGNLGILNQFQTNTEDDYIITFYIPAQIKPGSFSISIAVYDSKGFVSNTTTRMVKVVQLGGLTESAFLLQKSWDWKYSLSFYGEEKIEKRAGEAWNHHYKLVIPCQEGKLQEIDVQEEFKTDYLKLDFAPNGDFTMLEEGEEKRFDFKNTNCNEVAYLRNSFYDKRKGSWSYDHSHKNLILIFDPKYSDEEELFQESSILSFSIEGTNGKEIIFTNESYNVKFAQMVKTANIFSFE
ncbi:hypothetical protein [Flexithrix dorotheae]|uniref:hypothetical protein n=1 Tax=Flexithrix dorotheae TaxID=70993 RepID=UPI0003724FB6|nr:hypothetical protein [Flexithrix dorotheae]